MKEEKAGLLEYVLILVFVAVVTIVILSILPIMKIVAFFETLNWGTVWIVSLVILVVVTGVVMLVKKLKSRSASPKGK